MKRRSSFRELLHFLNQPDKDEILPWRELPPACRGPTYPAGFAGRSVPNPAGALTCIRRGARKSPLIRPAGFAGRSVPKPAGALTCIRKGARKSPSIRPAAPAIRQVVRLKCADVLELLNYFFFIFRASRKLVILSFLSLCRRLA